MNECNNQIKDSIFLWDLYRFPQISLNSLTYCVFENVDFLLEFKMKFCESEQRFAAEQRVMDQLHEVQRFAWYPVYL